MDADRKEQQQRLQQQEKKFDHTVRAFHLEEMAIRSGISEERQRLAPSLFEEYETNRIAKAMYDHFK
jgi:predicted  nucleic acid-binding Zn-ribbon protein